MFNESQEKVINLFGDFTTVVSDAKCKSIHGEEIKTVNTKQMLQRLPAALAQVKVSNTSEN